MAVNLRLRSGSSSEPSSVARHRATASRKKVDGIFASHVSSTDYPRTTVDTVFPLTSKIHKTLSQSGSITKRDIVGVIHLGATYSCCGYGWTDSRGSLVYHVLDNWMGEFGFLIMQADIKTECTSAWDVGERFRSDRTATSRRTMSSFLTKRARHLENDLDENNYLPTSQIDLLF